MKIIKIKIGDLIEKENLISLLKDKKFNKNITKLKTIMNLSRSNSSFLFKHSNTYTDDDLINYLMRCINDPNSSMNKDKKNNNLNLIYSNFNHLRSMKLKNLINESNNNKQKLKELSSNSLYFIKTENNNNNKNYKEKYEKYKEKFEKKINIENKKKFKILIEENSKEENNNNNNNKNKYSLNYSIFNDVNQFKNEIKFHIENAKDEESKKKFQEFLEKLEQMKNTNNKDYVKYILNMNSYKIEFEELINNKNMEERINKFLDKFYSERETIKKNRKNLSEKISVREYKFKSYFEKCLCN